MHPGFSESCDLKCILQSGRVSRITLKAPPMFALKAPLETRFLGFRRGDYFSFFGSITSLSFGGFLSGRGLR